MWGVETAQLVGPVTLEVRRVVQGKMSTDTAVTTVR